MTAAQNTGFLIGYFIGACLGNMLFLWLGCKIAQLKFQGGGGGGIFSIAVAMAIAQVLCSWYIALPIGAVIFWHTATNNSNANGNGHIFGAYAASSLCSFVVGIIILTQLSGLVQDSEKQAAESRVPGQRELADSQFEEEASDVVAVSDPGSAISPEELAAIKKKVYGSSAN